MPYSAPEGKTWIVEQVRRLQPKRVLDVGAGSGTYSTLLRPSLPDAFFTALEVYGPYIYRFDLHNKYNQVMNIELLQIAGQLQLEPRWDVVILGDVLEHFAPADTHVVYELARTIGRHVIISTPVEPWPQGSIDGNDHEAHLSQYTMKELHGLPGVIAVHREGVIGCVLVDGYPDDE